MGLVVADYLEGLQSALGQQTLLRNQSHTEAGGKANQLITSSDLNWENKNKTPTQPTCISSKDSGFQWGLMNQLLNSLADRHLIYSCQKIPHIWRSHP